MINKIKKYTPVALFVYKRAEHTRKTLEALCKNIDADKTDLFVFSDAAKNREEEKKVQEVRNIISNIKGFKSVKIIKQTSNKGLANSIIDGVSKVISQYGTVIVIEEDLITAPTTLQYFNKCLATYKDKSSVFSISAFNYPEHLLSIPDSYPYDVYYIPRMQCWGWATWQDRWLKADWSMKNFQDFYTNETETSAYKYWIGSNSLKTLNSCVTDGKDVWACRWVYTHYKHQGMCLCPVSSYIDNIGLDGTGENCGHNDNYTNNLSQNTKNNLNLPENVFIEPDIFKRFMTLADPGWQKDTCNE